MSYAMAYGVGLGKNSKSNFIGYSIYTATEGRGSGVFLPGTRLSVSRSKGHHHRTISFNPLTCVPHQVFYKYNESHSEIKVVLVKQLMSMSGVDAANIVCSINSTFFVSRFKTR